MSESALECEVISQIPQVLREYGGRLVAGLPARVVLDSGLSYAALGVYLVLAMMPGGVDLDGYELVGRGPSQDEVDTRLNYFCGPKWAGKCMGHSRSAW